MSGGMVERAIPSLRLPRIANPGTPDGLTRREESRVIRAAGGASGRRRARNRATDDGSPSTRITTLPGVLATHPERPHREARRWTKGRNPTPCTTPRAVISRAAEATEESPPGEAANEAISPSTFSTISPKRDERG